MAIKSLAQTLKDLATGIKNAITGITGSNATLTIIKGNGTTNTVTINNVANAGAATKATQDSAGQQINSTYIKGLSVSGQTITYTKGNNTTGTITTQDTVYTHPNSGVAAGTYKSVTVNAQGHVTGGSNPTTLAGYGITDASLKGHTHSQYLTASSDLNVNKLKGVISLDNLPAGALERLVKVTNDTARFTLTINDVQLGDTVKVESTKMMYIVKDITKLNSEDGYEQYTAGMASSVPWSGVTGKPSSYTPSAHTHDDRYYTESEINTKLAGKSDTSHTHDDRYYTESEIDSKVNTINSSIGTKADKTHTHDDRYYTESEIDSKLAGKQGSLTATGSATKGVYVDSSGTVKAMTYSVNKDVPSDAKFTDTVYTHPTTAGNKHIPSGGSSGQILRWSADGTAVWGADNNTTYSAFKGATSSAAGGAGLVPAPTAGAQAKYLRADGTWQTPPDTNTTYSASNGISLSGTTFSNSGVRSIATGGSNGTISVNTNGTTTNVAVKGLGSAAYTASSAYAAASHTHPQDNNFIAHGNEFNFIPTLPGNMDVYFNYRQTGGNNTSGYKITNYHFSNGAGSTNGVTLIAGTFNGALSGNAATATKATQDSAGQQINTTYIKGLSISGRNITYTKGNGTTGTITTQDTTYNFGGTTFYSGNQNTAEHNANNCLKNGHYYYTSNGPSTSVGASTTDGGLYTQSYNDSWIGQIAQDYRNGRLFVRGKNNGTWTSWLALLDSSNYNNYSPTKTGGGASGTWGISISGKANTAGTADIAKKVSGTYSHNGGQQGPAYFGRNSAGFLMSNANINSDTSYKNWLYMDNYESNDAGGATAFGVSRTAPRAFLMQSDANRSSWNNYAELLSTYNYNTYAPKKDGTGASGTWGINISGKANTAGTADTSKACSGNSASATKLATARNFKVNLASTGAASFNGTADATPGVTGTLPIANGGTGATTAAAARSNLGITCANIGAASASHTHSYVPLTGGTITGQISKQNISTSWVSGRNIAPFRTIATSSPGDSQYVPVLSAKTYQGSWDIGPYTSNILHFSYITDVNFNAGNNTQTADIQFQTNGTVVAKNFSGAFNGINMRKDSNGNIVFS